MIFCPFFLKFRVRKINVMIPISDRPFLRKLRLFGVVILCVYSLLGSFQQAKASHAMGADLTFRCLGGNNYELSLAFYRDCSGIPAPPSVAIEITSSCYPARTVTLFPAPNQPTEISPVCATQLSTCDGGTFVGVEQWIYRGTVVLNGPCSDWRFSFTECCRNVAITNVIGASGESMYVSAVLNNLAAPCNNSPIFSNFPVPFACVGQRFAYNHGVYDADGDSLVFQLVTPRTALNDSITYSPGFSATTPLSSSLLPPPVRFDPRTGEMVVQPSAQEVTVLAVLVSEYRNGVLIGQVIRDIQLNILPCSNLLPSLSGFDYSPLFRKSACVGTTINARIGSLDPNLTNNTTITWDNGISGGNFVVYGSNNAQGFRRDSAIFSWTPTLADVGSHYFTVTVVDDNCPYQGIKVETYIIDVYYVDVNAGTDQTVACGQCTSLNAAGIGGTGNYTFTWNPLQPDSVQGATLNPACQGTYVVRVSDGRCTNTDTVSVIPGAGGVQASFNTVTNCSGLPVVFTDQSVSVGGGISSWNWAFGDGSTSNLQNPTHLYAANGTYNVLLQVTTPSGCVDTLTQQVVVNTNIPVAQFSAPARCSGSITNFTNQTVGSAISSYSWDFDDPASGIFDTSTAVSPSHTFSAPGTYDVQLIVVNTSGCSDTIQQQVFVNSNTSISLTDQQACTGQSVTITAPGGFTAYLWSDGTSGQSTTVTPPFTNSYVVTVTDANGCNGTASSLITINPVPVANAGTAQTLCEGTPANLSGSGGAAGSDYSWNPGALNGANVTVTPTATTTYTLTITSGAGCSSSSTVTININPMPLVNADNSTSICKGDVVTINANSSISTYQWQPGNLNGSSITVSPLATTTYTVTVSDNIGCSGTDQVTITVNPIPDAAFNTTAPVCIGGSVNFTDASSITSGAINAWSWDFANGQNAQTQNASSNYSSSGNFNVRLIITSDGGCKDTITNAITINANPLANAGASQDICPGFQATLNGSGGSGYAWSPGGFTTSSITVSPTSTTQYTLTVTDANGCTNTAQASVNVNPVPNASAGLNQSICFGESTTLFATGGDTYVWSPGNVNTASLNVSPAATTDYTVIAANLFGCLDTAQVQVRVNPLPVASFVQSGPVCQSIPVNFTDQSSVGTGSISSWSWDLGNNVTSTTASPSLLYTASGNYTVRLIVTTSDGCKDTVDQPVSIYAEPTASFSSIDVCEGLPVQFSNSSSIADATPLTYSWDLGDNSTGTTQNISHQYAAYGAYPVTLIVRSGNGCNDTLTRFANVFALPTASFATQYACAEEVASFADQSTIPSGVISTWNWSFGDGGVDVQSNPEHIYSTPGFYPITLLVTSDQGCQDVTDGLIRIVPLPTADFETQDVCYGFETPLTDLSQTTTGSIVSYSWNLGDGTTSTDQNVTHIYQRPGYFDVSLTVTTDSGCVITVIRPNALNVFPPPPISFGDNASSASDIYPIVNFTNNTTTLGTYTWDFGDGSYSSDYSPTHEYAQVGVYEVQLIAVDLNGCVDTLVRRIEIRPTSNVYIPNAFSPNGDLKNDLFQVFSYNVSSITGQVFDRWGLQIYEWKGVNSGWDGTVDGAPVQSDVYVYRVVTTDVNNKREVHVGHVSLVR